MANFDWTEFYMELADKLVQYKDNRDELVKIVKNVFDSTKINLPKLDSDNDVFDIDPFTTFGLFNKGIGDEKRIKIMTAFANELSIESDIPQDFTGIPVLNNMRSAFHGFEKRGENDIDNLWKVFIDAMEYAKNPIQDSREKFIQSYDRVLPQNGVKWNITMGLFWVRPFNYINLDETTRKFLSKPESSSEEIAVKISNLASVPSGAEYLNICKLCEDLTRTDEYEHKNFPEISAAAWIFNKTNKNGNGENTEELLVDAPKKKGLKYNKEEQLKIGKQIYDGEINRYEASKKYGISDDTARKYMRKYRAENDLPPKKSSYNNRVSEAAPISNNLLKEKSYTSEDFLSEVFMDEIKYKRIISVLKHKKNIILQGPPGVGKTYAAKKLAYSIMNTQAEDHVKVVQFHQNYSYEDFIMGYKPTETGFELKKGIFYTFCEIARQDPNGEYFFIIDEINRGNMSKIFGELLMLIENNYRENYSVELAYNGESFSVPKNIYIIGMMNTADRSIAFIDFALRRRFGFVELEPEFDSKEFKKYSETVNNEKFNALIEKVKLLNEEIKADKSLGNGFCIGHSYFCEQKDCSDDELQSIVDYDILPTLVEYWIDDPSKFKRWEGILHEVLR